MHSPIETVQRCRQRGVLFSFSLTVQVVADGICSPAALQIPQTQMRIYTGVIRVPMAYCRQPAPVMQVMFPAGMFRPADAVKPYPLPNGHTGYRHSSQCRQSPPWPSSAISFLSIRSPASILGSSRSKTVVLWYMPQAGIPRTVMSDGG